MRVSMIGTDPLVSIMDAGAAIRANISAAYPMMWVDGAVCRGSVRSSCQDNPPNKGLPASVFDVIKANTGQLGDVVVLMSGYDDLVSSPNTNPPDLTPFRTDFEAVLNALQAEASVQHVVMLNLRTQDQQIPTLQVNKYNAMNGALGLNGASGYDADGRFPKLRVVDWNAASTLLNCGGSDDLCFQPDDGITPRINNGGANGLALYLRQQLDALPGVGTNPIEPGAGGNRCLAGGGVPPWSYVGISPGYPPQPPAPQSPSPGRFRSIDPVRLLDTARETATPSTG